MSREGLASFEHQSDLLLNIITSLTVKEWQMPSKCEGWTVHDVVAHMSALLNSPLNPMELIEVLRADDQSVNESPVEKRRALGPSALVGEYQRGRKWSLRLARALQAPVIGNIPLPMGDLGLHPQSFLPDTMAMDHHIHLRYDICAPNGPIQRPLPPVTERELAPIIAWLFRIIPPTNDGKDVRFEGWIDFEIHDPGTHVFSVRATTGGLESQEGPAASSSATVRSSTSDFLQWATGRVEWRGCDVEISGSTDAATTLLDHVKL